MNIKYRRYQFNLQLDINLEQNIEHTLKVSEFAGQIKGPALIHDMKFCAID